jgi:hypothetical protein
MQVWRTYSADSPWIEVIPECPVANDHSATLSAPGHSSDAR